MIRRSILAAAISLFRFSLFMTTFILISSLYVLDKSYIFLYIGTYTYYKRIHQNTSFISTERLSVPAPLTRPYSSPSFNSRCCRRPVSSPPSNAGRSVGGSFSAPRSAFPSSTPVHMTIIMTLDNQFREPCFMFISVNID